MLKLYSLLLYLLSILVSFFIGVSYAGWIEAAKGQMLAGGAIVLGYGVLGSGIGLLLALIIASQGKSLFIKRLNIFLTISLFLFIAFYTYKYKKRQQEDTMEEYEEESIYQKSPALPSKNKILTGSFSRPNSPSFQTSNKTRMAADYIGLGIFSPNILGKGSLYLRSFDHKSVLDSIVFNIDTNNNPTIVSAPPYLVPEHLKLDYGILIFSVRAIQRGFVEIVVNRETQTTSWVSVADGTVFLWPEFLLNVNSIELKDKETQIRIKPLDHASEVVTSYDFLVPLTIRNEWMEVNLVTMDNSSVGKGWIRWRSNNKILITYSLLS